MAPTLRDNSNDTMQVHAYDICRAKVDFKDCAQHACTEVCTLFWTLRDYFNGLEPYLTLCSSHLLHRSAHPLLVTSAIYYTKRFDSSWRNLLVGHRIASAEGLFYLWRITPTARYDKWFVVRVFWAKRAAVSFPNQFLSYHQYTSIGYCGKGCERCVCKML